jgi:DMSO reductase anchor subunit
VARSWLSREIVLVPLFAIFATAWLTWPPADPLWGWGLALLGFTGLYAVDRVYEVALLPGPGVLHSANVLLSPLFLIGVWIQHPILWGVAGLARLILYGQRKNHLARSQRDWRPGWTFLRILLGFGLPSVILVFDPSGLWLFALVAVFLGDLIDRCEFYAELEVMSPGLHMSVVLANHTRTDILRD